MPKATDAIIEPMGPLCVLPGLLAETLTEALETMAFVSPMPPAGLLPAAPLCRVRVGFTGQWWGWVEIVTPLKFGAVLVGNQLGCDPSDTEAVSHADDALRELTNVVCGLLLRKVIGAPPKQLELEPPILQELDVDCWPTLLSQHGVALDADGCPILIRVHSHGQDETDE
jgi:Chemotaxis phosphatase CheX